MQLAGDLFLWEPDQCGGSMPAPFGEHVGVSVFQQPYAHSHSPPISTCMLTTCKVAGL